MAIERIGNFAEGRLDGLLVIGDLNAQAPLWLTSFKIGAIFSPPVKIGTLICGAKVQVPVPAPRKSCENSELVVPTEHVSVILGKNAARAAPMLALAAFSVCSACRMSGRSCTSSDGNPAGMSSQKLGVVRRIARRGQIRRNRLPDKQDESVSRLVELTPVGQDIDLGRLDLPLCGPQIELITLSGVERRFVEVVHFLHRRQRLPREVQLLLGFPQGEILCGDLAIRERSGRCAGASAVEKYFSKACRSQAGRTRPKRIHFHTPSSRGWRSTSWM